MSPKAKTRAPRRRPTKAPRPTAPGVGCRRCGQPVTFKDIATAEEGRLPTCAACDP